jgi:SAM-dependent methyltransferase
VQQPSAGETARWYREDYWPQYREEQLGPARDTILEHVLEILDAQCPSRGALVDMGCGGGALLVRAGQAGWKGIGVDLSPDAVEAARARGVEAHVQDCLRCPLPDESAEAVTMVNVLDHLPDPFAALDEARRLLRPGGLLYLRVPNAPVQRLLASVPWVSRAAVFHLFGFGRRAFVHHLPRRGFAVASIGTAPPSLGYAYDAPSSRERRVWAVVKSAYRAVSRALSLVKLDRLAWGPSIEVVAVKTGPMPAGRP